jgi:hypothetical protein
MGRARTTKPVVRGFSYADALRLARELGGDSRYCRRSEYLVVDRHGDLRDLFGPVPLNRPIDASTAVTRVVRAHARQQRSSSAS